MHPAAVVGLGTERGLQRETIVVGNYDEPMPLSAYLELPFGLFAVNTPLSLYFYDAWDADHPLAFGQPINAVFEQGQQSYTVVAIHSSADTEYTPVSRVLFVVEERPTAYVPYGKALLKIVNAVAASLGKSISIDIFSENYTRIHVPFASSSNFLEFAEDDVVTLRVNFPTRTVDYTVQLHQEATTMFYLRGDFGPAAGYHGSASVVPFARVPTTPSTSETPVTPPTTCDNGYVESTGVCNCYSGYQTEESNQYVLCSVPPPDYCLPWSTNTSSMDSTAVPSLSRVRVNEGKLAFALTASLSQEQRTLVELPDPKCSFITSPHYYSKYVDDCHDVIDAWIPFADCGFTKSANDHEDVYRGTVVVKQITRVPVGETTMDRVVETPFTFLVRVPTNIAVQSTVEVIAPPPFVVPVSAVFVGQRVDAITRSAVLQYATSLPAPLAIHSAYLLDVPLDLSASLQLSDLNCTGSNACLQLLEVRISNISTCYISGNYVMVITVSCTSEQGCPAELVNTTADATLQSTIVSQNLCSDASVDIGLQGTLRAYSDSEFTTQALSFSYGQSAYFAIDASSSEATISQVTVTDVYYSGPNIPGRYLLSNGSASSLAEANNFQMGPRSSSQAWFSLDISVSAPNSADNTVFKLNNGQRGVYNFIAFADVEWQFADATRTKRVVLQSSVAPNTRFTAQVEITPPNDEAPTDSESSASSLPFFCLFVHLAVVTALLF
jgi:hypothetical protein